MCKIDGLVEKRFGDQTMECYALTPLYLNNLTIFVPQTLSGRMTPIRTYEEIIESIEGIADAEVMWITDVNARRKKYREIFMDGTAEENLRVLKTLYMVKQRRRCRGQKSTLCISDDHLYHDCRRITAEELAYSSGCSFDEALEKLDEMLNTRLSISNTGGQS